MWINQLSMSSQWLCLHCSISPFSNSALSPTLSPLLSTYSSVSLHTIMDWSKKKHFCDVQNVNNQFRVNKQVQYQREKDSQQVERWVERQTRCRAQGQNCRLATDICIWISGTAVKGEESPANDLPEQLLLLRATRVQASAAPLPWAESPLRYHARYIPRILWMIPKLGSLWNCVLTAAAGQLTAPFHPHASPLPSSSLL